jgi:hypothetical protein
MEYVLYALWILPPLGMLLLMLWSWLEGLARVQRGGRRSREPHDLLRQFRFLGVCSLITFFLDYYVIEGGLLDIILEHPIVDAWLPRFLVRLFLYPVILYCGALFIGGVREEPLRRSKKLSKRNK